MMAGIVGGTLAAASFIAGAGGAWAVVGLGAALALYAVAGLLAWRFPVPARHERWLSPAIGAVTGVVTGGTGVFVVPAVPYLQGLALKKEDLVQALGLSFTVSTVALAIGLASEHAFARGDLRRIARRRRAGADRYVDRPARARAHQSGELSPLVLHLFARAGNSIDGACVRLMTT